MQRAGNRRYYRPEDVELARRIHRLLNQEGYTVRGVQKLLRGKEAQAVDVSVVARELDEPPEQQEASPGGIDVFRLIALRDRLASALES